VKNDNPKIKTDEWGIKIAIQPTEWPSRVVSLGKPTARAGINSFGYGGANGHVILEAVDGPACAPPGGSLIQGAVQDEIYLHLLLSANCAAST
jgi:acyl transferase domain-containing protein